MIKKFNDYKKNILNLNGVNVELHKTAYYALSPIAPKIEFNKDDLDKIKSYLIDRSIDYIYVKKNIAHLSDSHLSDYIKLNIDTTALVIMYLEMDPINIL